VDCCARPTRREGKGCWCLPVPRLLVDRAAVAQERNSALDAGDIGPVGKTLERPPELRQPLAVFLPVLDTRPHWLLFQLVDEGGNLGTPFWIPRLVDDKRYSNACAFAPGFFANDMNIELLNVASPPVDL